MTNPTEVQPVGRVMARALAVTLLLLTHLIAQSDALPAGTPASDRDWLHIVPPATTSAGPAPGIERPGDDELAALHEKNYGAIEFLARFKLHVSSDGTLSKRAVIVRHFLTDSGVRDFGNFTLSARSEIEDLFLERGYLYLEDDTIRELDLARVQIVTGGSADVFSDIFDVMVPFEGLDIGSTAVLQWHTLKRVAQWPLPWSETYFLRTPLPVRRFEFEMTWDAGIDPPHWETDAGGLTCFREGVRSVRCEARDIEPFTIDEESQSLIETMPMLVVTERHGWEDLIRTESRLFADSLRSADQLDFLAGRVLGNTETPWDKLTRIHRFTADEIRYVALEHGAAAVVPAPVARTADRRYGDCKGKVALFVALAKRAGLDAYPVLVATDRSDPGKLITPSWQYFDHMIACVNLPAFEDPICIDQTVPGAGTGSLPPGLYGAVALELRPGTTTPGTIPIPRFVWKIEIESENTVLCNGDVTEVLTRRFRGAAEVRLRALTSGLSRDERHRWLLDDYRSVIAAEFEPDTSMTGVDNADAPMALKTTTRFKGTTPLNELQEFVEYEPWLYHYGHWFATTNEARPFHLRGARITSRTSFQVCDERDIGVLGPALDFESEFGQLERRYEQAGAEVIVLTTLELPTQTIEVPQLERYRTFLSLVLGQTRIWFGAVDKRQQTWRATR